MIIVFKQRMRKQNRIPLRLSQKYQKMSLINLLIKVQQEKEQVHLALQVAIVTRVVHVDPVAHVVIVVQIVPVQVQIVPILIVQLKKVLKLAVMY